MRKSKTKSLDMQCPKCGHTWLSIFVSGVIKRVIKCRACGENVKTSKAKDDTLVNPCPGCKRTRRKSPCEFCGW